MKVNWDVRQLLLPIMCVVTAALCGCVDYDERIEINPDGKTGTLNMHLAVDERFVAVNWPKVTGNNLESIFPTTLEDLKKEVNCPAVELVDARASVNTAVHMRHLYLVCRIKDASKLNDCPALAYRNLILRQDNATTWTFQQQLDVTGNNMLGSTPEQTAKAMAKLESTYGKENIRGILGNYHLTMSITMPEGYTGESADGKVHRKSTVTWERTIAQLVDSKEPWKMEARFAKEK
jgi:hypothetical protein